MGQASASMKVPPDVLKWAKGHGCDAFVPGGRIDERKWLAWFKENGHEQPTTPDAPLREQKLSEEIRKLRIKNDRDSGALVSRRVIQDFLAKLAAGIDQALEQKLCNEYPSAVAGLDTAQARIYGKRLGDDIRRQCREVVGKFL
jgi:hypothetical protein